MKTKWDIFSQAKKNAKKGRSLYTRHLLEAAWQNGDFRYPVDELGHQEVDLDVETDESLYLNSQQEGFLCDERSQMLRSLSNQNLRTIFFLISTTNSKAAVMRCLDFHSVPQERTVKKFLLEDSHLMRVEVCNLCARNLEICECGSQKEKCELIYGNLKKWLELILNCYRNIIIQTKKSMFEELPSSCPMSKGILKQKLLDEMADDEMWMIMIMSFRL